MQISTLKKIVKKTETYNDVNYGYIANAIKNSWSIVAPFWPLRNIIAVNPIAGLENLKFEEALNQANAFFQQDSIPDRMHDVNRESIKWLQAFFDDGQSTIKMPMRHKGFFSSFLNLIKYDENIHQNDEIKLDWINSLSTNPEQVIHKCLVSLDISKPNTQIFLTLMLTTLPGWSSYIKYRTEWADEKDKSSPCTVSKSEYLAFRLVLTCLIWQDAKKIIPWHKKCLLKSNTNSSYMDSVRNEQLHKEELLKKINPFNRSNKNKPAKAQFVFCIDVRSEPFRRQLELQGDIETFGFAGFFGVPIATKDSITEESKASCPVLLKPNHTVLETPVSNENTYRAKYNTLSLLKKAYHSVKYTFTTPFSLVEVMGFASGLWLGVRSLSPNASKVINQVLKINSEHQCHKKPDISSIPLRDQVNYSLGALKLIGLTENFSPLVVFCGHGSTTQNNAYETALNCGACRGNNGAPNARLISEMLNSKDVRLALENHNICIPTDTLFIAAEHNTTTDHVEIYDYAINKDKLKDLTHLKKSLYKARIDNNIWRSRTMDNTCEQKSLAAISRKSEDWSEVRPEWGLAKNASFIVGPRWLTKDCDLEGRSFLHSYEWEKDNNQEHLTTILTAPMIVAQWINAQYYFSTIDNVAFGGGSKVTKNITGKIGTMQGNASDLMHGLPLQSVYRTDTDNYHEPVRLTTVIYAPHAHIDKVIKDQPILQKLFGNGWINLVCCDPELQINLTLKRDLSWTKQN